jgi:hypothetical protein
MLDPKSRGIQYSSRSRNATCVKPSRRALLARRAYARCWKTSPVARHSASSRSTPRPVTSGRVREIRSRMASDGSSVPLTHTSMASNPKWRWWKTQSAM